MRISLIFLLLCTVGASAFAQPKQYVCTPCGQDCDRSVVHHAGACSACGMALVEKETFEFKDLSLDELCARITSNPKLVLLDVRSPQEFNGSNGDTYGHFKNAININIGDLERRLKELEKFKDEEVIVYCSHSHRSPRAAYILSSKGFNNVSNMSGGVSTLAGKVESPCLKKYFVFH
jgi:rhodanese-related sulfurtransferase